MAARMVTKKPVVEDARKLSGPEKAAVILLALGADHTALWESLHEDEIKEISQAMARLGTVNAQVVENTHRRSRWCCPRSSRSMRRAC